MGRYLAILVFLAITQGTDLFIRADLLDVPLYDDIAELLVQFDGAADAVGLFTGDERGAGAAEGVKHDGIRHRAVLNGVRQKRNRLHGGMVTVFLGLVELPDGGLFAAGVPLVLAFLLPTVKARFVLPLVRRAAQYQGLLLPDTTAGEVEPGGIKGFSEIQPLGVGMEHIDGRIVRHDLLHIGKGIEEEVEKLLRCHVVVFDFPGAALVVHIVGRVGDDEVCLATIHEDRVGFLFGAVAADESMPSQRPDVAGLREGRLLQLGIHIEIILLNILAVIEQL